MEPLNLNPPLICAMPTAFGEFELCVWPELHPIDHFILKTPNFDSSRPLLARIHSECVTGDCLGALNCDCGPQLRHAMLSLEASGSGILIYLRQEGRGAGLVTKVKGLISGLPTHLAYEAQGLAPDLRQYHIAAAMLKSMGIDQIQLMTNNPDKAEKMRDIGINVVAMQPHFVLPRAQNRAYLATKAEDMRHLLKEKLFIKPKPVAPSVGLAGVENLDQLKGLADELGTQYDGKTRKLEVGLLYQFDEKFIADHPDWVKQLETMANWIEANTNWRWAVHYNVGASSEAVKQLAELRWKAPFMKRVQFNHLPLPNQELLEYALTHFDSCIQIPPRLDGLSDNEEFVSTCQTSGARLLLDASLGRGRVVDASAHLERARHWTPTGLERLGIAGGFSAANAHTFREIEAEFGKPLSVDAESSLRSEGHFNPKLAANFVRAISEHFE